MKYFLTPYDAAGNDIDADVPEHWANAALMVLEESMVAANLVHRDYEHEFQEYGDTVNARRPVGVTATRKGVDDNVSPQAAELESIPIVLNQHVYSSFILKDQEITVARHDLVSEFIVPHAQALARFVDLVVMSQVHRFNANSGGGLGELTTSNGVSQLLETRKAMDDALCPPSNRNMILSTNSEMNLLNLEQFISAEKVGDEGTALREASLGEKLGFNLYKAQNTPSVATDPDTGAGSAAQTVDGAHAKGSTSIALDGTGELTVGGWLKIAGDNTPQMIVSTTTATDNTEVTISPGLKNAVADTAVVTDFEPAAVNLTAGYASGWFKAIVLDGFTVAPQVGQAIYFDGDTDNVYGIIQYDSTTSSVLLDRPLDAAISNNDVAGLSPAGDYNFAFVKDALTLAIRPLAMPMAGAGALSGLVSYNGLTVRIVISYDSSQQGHLVTLDFLAGIALLNEDCGAAMYG